MDNLEAQHTGMVGARLCNNIVDQLTQHGQISKSDGVRNAVEFYLMYRDFELFGGGDVMSGETPIEKFAMFTATISAENSQLRRQYGKIVTENKKAMTKKEEFYIDKICELQTTIDQLKEDIDKGCYFELLNQLTEKQA